MKLFRFLFLYLSLLVFAGCSGSSGSSGGVGGGFGPGGGKGGDEILSYCDEVVTAEKILAFNQSQKNFQIQASGASTHCEAQAVENGNTRRVKASGHSHFAIFPKLIFDSVTFNKDSSWNVKTEIVKVSAEDIKSIVSQMNLSTTRRTAQDYLSEQGPAPAFIRFGKGELFMVDRFSLVDEKDRQFATLVVPPRQQAGLLADNFKNFEAGLRPLEVLWSPSLGLLPSLELDRSLREPSWNRLDAVDVIRSSVKDSAIFKSTELYNLAIARTLGWQIDPLKVHRVLPELYQHAESEWRTPNFNANTTYDLQNLLKYIIAINPSSDKKPILTTYQRIEKFVDDGLALKTAYEQVTGKSPYSADQFELLIATSNVLYPAFFSQSWKISRDIAQRTNFDRPASLFAAQVGTLLLQNGLMNRDDVSPIFLKINAGMSSANMNFYFSSFTYFKDRLRARTSSAEKACDKLILTGKMTPQNQSVYLDLISWLASSAYIRIDDSIPMLIDMSEQRSLDYDQVNLFKATFTWLTDSMYINRSEALTRVSSYMKKYSFVQVQLDLMKSYSKWLKDSIYLNNSDALAKVEEAVLAKNLPKDQIENIQSLSKWYIDSIYMSHRPAFERAEKLVVQKNLSPSQAQVMKDVVKWLVSSIYLNQKEAADKGEVYVLGPKPLDAARAQQLMKLAKWYIDFIYKNQREALTRSEKLVIELAIPEDRTQALQNAAKWLIDTFYMSQSNAADKAEGYLIQKGLTEAKLNELKNQYKAFKDKGKSNQDALKLAEEKAL